jgi:hypothetical protein
MITQIELDKKLSQVFTRLNMIKEDSILLKPPNERRDIYDDIKRIRRQERERLEKEEELLNPKS